MLILISWSSFPIWIAAPTVLIKLSTSTLVAKPSTSGISVFNANVSKSGKSTVLTNPLTSGISLFNANSLVSGNSDFKA